VRFGIVAFHYPRPEFADELVERVRHAAELMRAVDGCLDAACWRDESSGAVVSTGTFVSREAWHAALAAAAAADVAYDEREERERDVYTLVEP
jgi:quinol monooxygenase YgiN